MVKKAYAELKKKYSALPNFAVLDTEFEISSLEKTDFLLRQIKKLIEARLETLQNILSNILQPDPGSFVDLNECGTLSPEEKEVVVELHRKLMVLYRRLNATDFVQENKKDVEIIQRIVNEWPALRKAAVPIIQKLSKAWENVQQAKEVLEYLG